MNVKFSFCSICYFWRIFATNTIVLLRRLRFLFLVQLRAKLASVKIAAVSLFLNYAPGVNCILFFCAMSRGRPSFVVLGYKLLI